MTTLAPSFWNFFILAAKEDRYKSLCAFEFQPDPTTDYGVDLLHS